MIGAVLKADIEHFVAGLRRNSPLLVKARRGLVSPQAVSAYLHSVRYLVQCTAPCLRRGSARARQLGRHQLADHFEHKLDQELGHERWADADIRLLESGFAISQGTAAPAVVELVDYLLKTIDERPERYLAYMLFAESITVMLGPEWMDALQEHCGIPRDALSVVEHHVALDREHADEGLREIDALVQGSELLEEMRATLADSMRYFSRFDRELSNFSN